LFQQKANKIAMAQEDTTNPSVGWVKLENSATGTITLTADKGIGMLYVPKNLTASTTVENKGTIK